MERRALLRLDDANGTTRWGVKNVGEKVTFVGNALYVFDRHEQMDLLGNNGLSGGLCSVRCLSPRNGSEKWSLVQKGQMYQQELTGKKVFVVTSIDPPAGRMNPTCAYQLQIVEAK